MFPTYMRGTALVLCSFPAFILEYALRMTLGELDFWVKPVILGLIVISSAFSCVVLQETLGKEIDEMPENTLTLPLLQPRLD